MVVFFFLLVLQFTSALRISMESQDSPISLGTPTSLVSELDSFAHHVQDLLVDRDSEATLSSCTLEVCQLALGHEHDPVTPEEGRAGRLGRHEDGEPRTDPLKKRWCKTKL